MKALIAETEELIRMAQAKKDTQKISLLLRLQEMIYSGNVANSEIKKVLNSIGQDLIK